MITYMIILINEINVEVDYNSIITCVVNYSYTQPKHLSWPIYNLARYYYDQLFILSLLN